MEQRQAGLTGPARGPTGRAGRAGPHGTRGTREEKHSFGHSVVTGNTAPETPGVFGPPRGAASVYGGRQQQRQPCHDLSVLQLQAC